MEVAIVVAIIAAVVSLITLIGNIYISRQTLKSSDRRLGLEIDASLTKSEYEVFKEFEKQTELFKIRCMSYEWWIERVLDRWIDSPKESVKLINENHVEFMKQLRPWEEAWSSVRPHVPRNILDYVVNLHSLCFKRVEMISVRPAITLLENYDTLLVNHEKYNSQLELDRTKESNNFEQELDRTWIKNPDNDELIEKIRFAKITRVALRDLVQKLDLLIEISRTMREVISEKKLSS
ncbi:hypothetical protein [Pseudanabaena sp. PCC 6802]|uniref:hypothetical protein n=1 Tax=Pseudanabaena sp. PCC 6802 TaxID=118173 RepID=UPI00034D1AFC|nr:hypothetical protein [Pseudanabaena sp. PCC 6802]